MDPVSSGRVGAGPSNNRMEPTCNCWNSRSISSHQLSRGLRRSTVSIWFIVSTEEPVPTGPRSCLRPGNLEKRHVALWRSALDPHPQARCPVQLREANACLLHRQLGSCHPERGPRHRAHLVSPQAGSHNKDSPRRPDWPVTQKRTRHVIATCRWLQARSGRTFQPGSLLVSDPGPGRVKAPATAVSRRRCCGSSRPVGAGRRRRCRSARSRGDGAGGSWPATLR